MGSLFSLALIILLSLSLLSTEAEAKAEGIRSARLLDLLIRDYIVKSFDMHLRTGIVQTVNLPANFSGIKVDAARFRCGSLHRYGAQVKEFYLGRGVNVQPCADRVMASSLKMPEQMGWQTDIEKPSVTRCLCCDRAWPLRVGRRVTAIGACEEEISRWKLAVGSSTGAALGAFLLGLLLMSMLVKVRKKARTEEMERRAYEEEALQVSMVGNTRAPMASGTRTTPTIEHEYQYTPYHS
ncbi:hypothetical protein V6N13_077023 [Hibiscus sabdariffa]|uniref:Transmembrane protein n=1 Tax=Hibiscus sabdariffa TaxID=183260 RepID=A0ABR2CML1_9ROSI